MKILNEKGLVHFASSGAPADKEGYLHKKGEVNKGFQKRWFVLKGNLLFYYEKKDDREPQGLIVLEGCTIELAEDTENFLFMINFASSGLRTYCLSAPTQEIMESWMKALSCAGYEYVKLMVSDLQGQLEKLQDPNNIDNNVMLLKAAERDSQILGRVYNDNVCDYPSRESRSKSNSLQRRGPDKRVNPFDTDDTNSECDPGDAFRRISSRSSVGIELVTWSLLGVTSFADMHEFVRHQVQDLSLESSEEQNGNS